MERRPAWEVILACAAGPMSVPGAPSTSDSTSSIGSSRATGRSSSARPRYTVLEHHQWVEQTRAAAREFLRFWDDVDVLVTPTSGILPPSVDWAPWDQPPDVHMATFMGFANFAQPFNLSGQPGVSVPAVWTDDGLPVGVQLVGRPFAEATLLQVARQLEVSMPWDSRRPPAFV